MTQTTKIAIIGRGTAGCQGLAYFFATTDCEIDVYHDSSRHPQSVGESSTVGLPVHMFKTLNFQHHDLAKINGTLKTGVRKTDWSYGGDFTHSFPPPSVSYHFDAVKLQEYILRATSKSKRVRVIEASVDAEDIDADFVLDCSGTPRDYSGHRESCIPVNCALVLSCDWDTPRFNTTLTLARPWGWVFGIPLGSHCSVGYLYNRNLSDVQTIEDDLAAALSDYELKCSSTPRIIEFENYYKIENFRDRVAYSGNASFFLDPIEATSIELIHRIQRLAAQVWSQRLSVEEANRIYAQTLRDTEVVILLHYLSGGAWDTAFWRMAASSARARIAREDHESKLWQIVETAEQYPEAGFVPDELRSLRYGPWGLLAFVQNLSGLELYPKLAQLRSRGPSDRSVHECATTRCVWPEST